VRVKTYLVVVLVVALVFLFLYPSLHAAASHEPKSKHRAIETKAETLVKYLGRFHPIAVHFPIAFAFGALLTEFIFLTTRRPSFVWGSRLMLYLGLIGMVVAIPLGLAAVAEYGGDHLIDSHQTLAWSSFMAILLTTGIKEAVQWKYLGGRWLWGYRILLLLTAFLVAWTGYVGGEMVHGVGHLSWPS
jgi:uncharacterized membrane protein